MLDPSKVWHKMSYKTSTAYNWGPLIQPIWLLYISKSSTELKSSMKRLAILSSSNDRSPIFFSSQGLNKMTFCWQENLAEHLWLSHFQKYSARPKPMAYMYNSPSSQDKPNKVLAIYGWNSWLFIVCEPNKVFFCTNQ